MDIGDQLFSPSTAFLARWDDADPASLLHRWDRPPPPGNSVSRTPGPRLLGITADYRSLRMKPWISFALPMPRQPGSATNFVTSTSGSSTRSPVGP
jgi:hypothetical protein